MEYYFTDKKNIQSETLLITGDDSKHLLKVLKKGTGEEIFVTDGERNLYRSIIEDISDDNINCRIIEKYFNLNESAIKITLYQSLLKNPSRFEFVIEKSVELGVFEIIPIITENVIIKERDRCSRWQSIALSAMKQSQRCYLPKIQHPVNFIDAIGNAQNTDLKILADERDNPDFLKLPEINLLSQTISLFIGPEGGFTLDELQTASNNGFKILNLGKRKLRSETAALAALGKILV
ncbi:MAG: RsmE family RNA methyltransferase [Ignavibacteria bacterium]